MFYEIVRKLPEGSQVVLESSSDRAVLAVRAGRSRFTLQTLPESDFPDLTAGDMTHKFVLAGADLKRLIDKTQFAISTEETRYYLNGIYLHVAGSAAATTPPCSMPCARSRRWPATTPPSPKRSRASNASFRTDGNPDENGERPGKGRIRGGPALRNAVRRVTFVVRQSTGA